MFLVDYLIRPVCSFEPREEEPASVNGWGERLLDPLWSLSSSGCGLGLLVEWLYLEGMEAFFQVLAAWSLVEFFSE